MPPQWTPTRTGSRRCTGTSQSIAQYLVTVSGIRRIPRIGPRRIGSRQSGPSAGPRPARGRALDRCVARGDCRVRGGPGDGGGARAARQPEPPACAAPPPRVVRRARCPANRARCRCAGPPVSNARFRLARLSLLQCRSDTFGLSSTFKPTKHTPHFCVTRFHTTCCAQGHWRKTRVYAERCQSAQNGRGARERTTQRRPPLQFHTSTHAPVPSQHRRVRGEARADAQCTGAVQAHCQRVSTPPL